MSFAKKFGRVIVVDDGSNDKTAELAGDAGATIVIKQKNAGYDEAIQAGIRHALTTQVELIATLDADGQHTEDSLRRALSNACENSVVIGNRSSKSRVLEHVFGFVGRICWGVSDPLCGLKVMPCRTAEQSLKIPGLINTSPIITGKKVNDIMCNVPVEVRDRDGSSRFGSTIKANLTILFALVRAIRYEITDHNL